MKHKSDGTERKIAKDFASNFQKISEKWAGGTINILSCLYTNRSQRENYQTEL